MLLLTNSLNNRKTITIGLKIQFLEEFLVKFFYIFVTWHAKIILYFSTTSNKSFRYLKYYFNGMKKYYLQQCFKFNKWIKAKKEKSKSVVHFHQILVAICFNLLLCVYDYFLLLKSEKSLHFDAGGVGGGVNVACL